MKQYTFILGADDPEMSAIESLVIRMGHVVAHALDDNGGRVRPATAYKSVGVSCYTNIINPVAVECDGPGIPEGAIRVDHHREGDPGYGRPPSEFMQASSLGQVISLLALDGCLPLWETTRSQNFPIIEAGQIGKGSFSDSGKWAVGLPDNPPVIGQDVGGFDVPAGWLQAIIPVPLVIVAAADHCLPAAYKGECPGVDVGLLRQFREETRAAFQKRSVEAVRADIERACSKLREAPELVPGVKDMRGPTIPELPEAACREGICFVASMTERDGRIKTVCQAGTPEQISALIEWMKSNGLVGIYGDPARGFAGGYS